MSMTAAQPAPEGEGFKKGDKSDDKSNMTAPMTAETEYPGNRSAEVDLIGRALDILGSPRKLAEWMRASIPALQGKTPYSLMNSEEGRTQVEAVLGRIEHGVY